MRIALGIEYDGRGFCGWQTQPSRCSVQDALEQALSSVAGTRIAVTTAGRTDTGVHAIEQVVHFDTEVTRPLSAWTRGVNTYLPSNLVVLWAKEVPDAFHARFGALSRTYQYLLLNRSVRPALLTGRVGWYHQPLDAAAMVEAAQLLMGEHDFSSFRAAECQAKSPVRTLSHAEVDGCGELLRFTFTANAFLHHMVRNMVGCLLYVGNGSHAPTWITEVLAARDRRISAPTFSADGLYLTQVRYHAQWALPQRTDCVSLLRSVWQS